MLKSWWWKILSFVLLIYTCTMGFLVKIPVLDGRMQQTVRNLFFHVPMWFCMQTLFIVSVIYAIRFLANPKPVYDIYSLEFARTGLVFGILGIITGAIWANYQWGKPWSGDPKQNGAAIALLIYLAYFVLRGSVTDESKRARLSAVYNIFAFAMLFPTIWILPRLTESLHPGGQGSQGNPGLNPNDTTPEMESVFLPAIIGWILLGVWISTLRIRLQNYKEKILAVLNHKKSLLLILFCLMLASSYAQQMNYSKEEPTDFMNSNGKIFVVMAVVVIIVIGLFIYLINLDRKIKKLEKNETDKV